MGGGGRGREFSESKASLVYIGVLEVRGRELDSETPGQKKNPTNKVHVMPRYCRYGHFTSKWFVSRL